MWLKVVVTIHSTRARIFRRGTLRRQKKMIVSVRLGQIKLGFFFTANCPTAKSPLAKNPKAVVP